MKINYFILLISFLLAGSQIVSAQSTKTGDLPVIDFTKEYPKETINLQDIADIEYVPLETTDEILLSGKASLSAITEKYIILYEPVLGDIYIFNRKGKIHSHFNHKGSSGKEYSFILAGVIFDEKKEELYVCSQVIQIYSLTGEYKRTLKVNTLGSGTKVLNYDDEALLIYEDINIDPGFKGKIKEYPYRFISKKDGHFIANLELHLPERYTNRIAQKDGKMWRPIIQMYIHNMYYGDNFIIADFSSDTTYLLTKNKKLTPLFVRKPSVHAPVDKKTLWSTPLITEKFIIISLTPLEFNLNSSHGRMNPTLMYDINKGKILYDARFADNESALGKWSPGRWGPSGAEGIFPALPKNTTAELVLPESIKNAYKRKKLKGDIEKLATTLNDDDNPVVRIIKFK